MKVLKHGKVNRVVTCNCGCEFEFDMGDIQSVYDISSSTAMSSFPKKYVICPDCGAKIYIISPLDTQEYKISW